MQILVQLVVGILKILIGLAWLAFALAWGLLRTAFSIFMWISFFGFLIEHLPHDE